MDQLPCINARTRDQTLHLTNNEPSPGTEPANFQLLDNTPTSSATLGKTNLSSFLKVSKLKSYIQDFTRLPFKDWVTLTWVLQVSMSDMGNLELNP